MKALTDHTVESLREQFSAWNCKPSHAGKLLREFYNNGGGVDFSEMRLGRILQERISSDLPLRQSKILSRNESADGTVKLLLGFDHGGAVETVLMPTPIADRAAGCVSSQIGCAMGCDFCASTKRGLERNLEAGEIVEQFLHLREQALQSGRRLATLVFMGMGEPLQNFDNVLAGIRRIGGEDLGALGWKQITVSTVGIVPEMYKLAESKPNVALALSIHAPDDETRSKIVPMNRRYPVKDIVAAAKHYYETTGRITNLEYCILRGVNDSDEHARMLADLLQGFRTHVNLIPYNSIGESLSGVVYGRPDPGRIELFEKILRERGVVTHQRRTRGEDVNAACGQLREMSLTRGA
jgi:23S rRNA (adenine2503-C2)-methyltransferase